MRAGSNRRKYRIISFFLALLLTFSNAELIAFAETEEDTQEEIEVAEEGTDGEESDVVDLLTADVSGNNLV